MTNSPVGGSVGDPPNKTLRADGDDQQPCGKECWDQPKKTLRADEDDYLQSSRLNA
jgi:hypothetical protein